ncbi:MAG: hypothetical protein IPJ65_35565 [Archangiaceae bacterium]|nr:hypothetical protein [Archangiaceae bacterium]
MVPTVLLCLDDHALSAALTDRVRLLGWLCMSGDFIATAVRARPDLLLLDAHREDLLVALKRDPRTQGLSVVVIGGDTEQQKRCLEHGALAFFARSHALSAFDSLLHFIEHGRTGAAPDHPPKSLARPAPAAQALEGPPVA